jgi:hypothetical protein
MQVVVAKLITIQGHMVSSGQQMMGVQVSDITVMSFSDYVVH